MKTSKTFVKTLAIALLTAAGLSGCVAVPYGPDPYGPDPYGPQTYGPPAYSAPLIVPSISLGFGFGGRRHHHHRRGRW